MMLKLFLGMGLIASAPFQSASEYVPPSPEIVNFFTNFPEKDNWVTVPEGTKEITITVEALNTETVLFWLIPTGTETWNERKLIGYDIKDDGDNFFSLTWKVPGPLLNHLEVQAIGETGMTGASLNITSNP
ncbi:hypothetical protein [Mesobacillus thioparans]|uniref:hypothetical protein n=1 Tax=Mesobacillus thioparans TaxID=370439 RepID=UPI0039EE66BE